MTTAVVLRHLFLRHSPTGLGTRCRAPYNACVGSILPYQPYRSYLAQRGRGALTCLVATVGTH